MKLSLPRGKKKFDVHRTFINQTFLLSLERLRNSAMFHVLQMVSVKFSAHISATFISANTTRRRQSQRLFNSARSNTALIHFGDLHFSEHNSPLPNTAPIEIV